MIKNKKICVVGLGYVGIPLAISLVNLKLLDMILIKIKLMN